MPTCPLCHQTAAQVKAGKNASGSQRYQCRACLRSYTPSPEAKVYPDATRRQAIQLHATGKTFREIGRTLGVNHQSVINWVRDESESSRKRPESRERADAPLPVPAEPPVVRERRSTIADVARQAGVSISTVSNFLNDKGHMGPETHRRIAEAIQTLHFTPSALARAIRERRTRIIGVLIFKLLRHPGMSGVDDFLTGPLLEGIYEAVDAAGYDILIYSGWPDRPARHSGADFLSGHIDGLLWFVPKIGAPALTRLAAAGLPVIGAMTRHVPDTAGYVTGDNIGAVRDMVAHLVRQGHRRIAFAGPIRSSNFGDRLEGYRQGLSAAGLPLDPVLEAAGMAMEHSPEVYAGVLAQWLALPEPPTAIVMVSDYLASWMASALQNRGLRVPEDMALTGFDDSPLSESLCGGLTTVHQPLHQIGQLAAEKLIALIEGAPIQTARVTLPLPLVTRASTAHLRQNSQKE